MYSSGLLKLEQMCTLYPRFIMCKELLNERSKVKTQIVSGDYNGFI